MKDLFVKTENTLRFYSALGALQERGASEACLMVVDGVPGLGKTETLNWFAVQSDCIFLRTKKEWTPPWFMKELLEQLNVTPEHSFQKNFQLAVQTLGLRSHQATLSDEVFAIVIDEVDHIVRKSSVLETIRDLSDLLEIPIIFVGMGRVRHSIKRFPQIASRVGQYVEFLPATLGDITNLVTELCEVEVKPDLIEFLHKSSRGLMREAMEGISSIERFGKLNQGPIGCQEMAGQQLLNDRNTGKPIKVKG